MSNEQVKFGLQLSEAIKLIEENPGAKIRQTRTAGVHGFYSVVAFPVSIDELYDVKLPPPKSVTVTREMLHKAWLSVMVDFSPGKRLEQFCKELGL